MPKKMKGLAPRYGMLRGKNETLFWLNSRGQKIQFGALL